MKEQQPARPRALNLALLLLGTGLALMAVAPLGAAAYQLAWTPPTGCGGGTGNIGAHYDYQTVDNTAFGGKRLAQILINAMIVGSGNGKTSTITAGVRDNAGVSTAWTTNWKAWVNYTVAVSGAGSTNDQTQVTIDFINQTITHASDTGTASWTFTPVTWSAGSSSYVLPSSGTTYGGQSDPTDAALGAVGITDGATTCSGGTTTFYHDGSALSGFYSPYRVLVTSGTANIPTALGVVSERHVGAGGACQLVNWTAPAAGPAPTGYSVFVHTGDPVPSLVDPMNSSGQWVYTGHVDGLSKDTCALTWAQDQWWAVVATNAAGEGIAGGPTNNTTVAGPPSFVQATATNTTLVHVNWSVAIAPNSSATGWSVFSKASPEGSPSWALNASGYAFEGHVDKPTQQLDVTSLTTGTTYCFRVEGTNASAWGEGDISGTVACATTGNITLPPVLSGVYVPCSTFALSWSLPNGTIDGYRIDQSAPALPFVNRSFFVPPDGNFSLRLLNVSFPQVSGELDYAAFAHSPLGYSASSNVVNFTPPAVSTIGDCGLQWGGQSQADFAAQAGISVPAAQSMVSIFLIVIGAGIGLVAMGNGAGVVGGVGAGLLLSAALGLVPAWAVMFALVAGAALGIVGAMLGMGLRKVNRGGLGR